MAATQDSSSELLGFRTLLSSREGTALFLFIASAPSSGLAPRRGSINVMEHIG